MLKTVFRNNKVLITQAIIVFLLFTSDTAEATLSKSEKFLEASDQVSEDLIYFDAYYNIGNAAAINSGYSIDNKKWEEIESQAMNLAFALSTPEKAKARYELAFKTELATFKKEGMSRLILTYQDGCKFLIEHPDERVKQLMGD
ncbi:MAG: hypothetical protein NVS3B3_07820 [Aquirhabdus sp.]